MRNDLKDHVNLSVNNHFLLLIKCSQDTKIELRQTKEELRHTEKRYNEELKKTRDELRLTNKELIKTREDFKRIEQEQQLMKQIILKPHLVKIKTGGCACK